MTVLKPRSRMISVRLSEEEYTAMRQLCATTGARSVSDLTRDAMRALLGSSTRDSGFGNDMAEFHARISQLDRRVEELAKRVESAINEQES